MAKQSDKQGMVDLLGDDVVQVGCVGVGIKHWLPKEVDELQESG